MNKLLLSSTIIIALLAGCAAKKEMGMKKHMNMFQSVKMNKAILLQDGKNKTSCINCGMKLPMFYKTNHASKVDGKTKQYCSIHCLAKDINSGKNVTQMRVVDTSSLEFIDAKKAFYVIGSKQKGTMSKVSKYAFSNEKDAKAFADKNGGNVGSFEDALNEAKKDF